MIKLLHENPVYIVLITGISAMGFAHYSEIFMGLRPCDLCYQQRYIWYGIIALSIVTIMLKKQNNNVFLLSIMAILSASLLLGGYHAGIEYNFWQGPQDCTGAIIANNADDFAKMLLQRTMIKCDDVQWDILGISMAGFNAIISLGLISFMIIKILQDKKENNDNI